MNIAIFVKMQMASYNFNIVIKSIFIIFLRYTQHPKCYLASRIVSSIVRVSKTCVYIYNRQTIYM